MKYFFSWMLFFGSIVGADEQICRTAFRHLAEGMPERYAGTFRTSACTENVVEVLARIEDSGYTLTNVSVLLLTHEERQFSGIAILQSVDLLPRKLISPDVQSTNYHAIVLFDRSVIDLHFKPTAVRLEEYLTEVFPPYDVQEAKSYRIEDRWNHLKGRVIPARHFREMVRNFPSHEEIGVRLGRHSQRNDFPFVSVRDLL